MDSTVHGVTKTFSPLHKDDSFLLSQETFSLYSFIICVYIFTYTYYDWFTSLSLTEYSNTLLMEMQII